MTTVVKRKPSSGVLIIIKISELCVCLHSGYLDKQDKIK